MRKYLAALAVAFTACGGGGGGGGAEPAPLNEHEERLVGLYILEGFEGTAAGIPFDQDDFASWSGTIAYGNNRRVAQEIEIDGTVTPLAGTWAANSTTIFFDPDGGGDPQEPTYVWDDFGAFNLLTTHSVGGDIELTRYWTRD